jgi:hypothetical protein
LTFVHANAALISAIRVKHKALIFIFIAISPRLKR